MASVRVKRSRIEPSPSDGDAGGLLLHQTSAAAATEPAVLRFDSNSGTSSSGAGVEALKQSPVAMATPILTLSSPEIVTEEDEWQSGGYFLEKCFYCKKRFFKEDHLFMYRSFRAFCSPYCRAKVIIKEDDDFKMELEEYFSKTMFKTSKKNKRVEK